MSKARPKTHYRKPARDDTGAQGHKRLTSERLSADLDAFRKSGGRVEVLGTTRVLTRLDSAGDKDSGTS